MLPRLLCLALMAQAGCSLLFSSDFPNVIVQARAPIYEGALVPVILETRSPIDPESITLRWVDQDLRAATIVDHEQNENRLALLIQIPPNLTLANGAVSPLELVLDGEPLAEVEVTGLEEATFTGAILTSDILPLYSQITVEGFVTAEVRDSGSKAPLLLRATHSILLAGDEDGAGGISVSALDDKSGPGACEAACTATNTLVPLEKQGGAALEGGGGGGGVLELSTLGFLAEMASMNFRLSARGGDVAPAGPGGAILVRAREFRGAPADLRLSYTGGSAAEPGEGGRARVDAPLATESCSGSTDCAVGRADDGNDPPMSAGESNLWRGPMFRPEANTGMQRYLLGSGDEPVLRVLAPSQATTGDPFTAIVDIGGAFEPADVDETGPGEYEVSFTATPGKIHRVCLLLEGAYEPDELFHEGQNCKDVAIP